MTARKIDLMHLVYGSAQSGQCKDCPHFTEGYYHDRKLMKCSVYGMTHSEATDWRKKWPACALINLPFPDNENRIIDRIKTGNTRLEKPIVGQITMDELLHEERR